MCLRVNTSDFIQLQLTLVTGKGNYKAKWEARNHAETHYVDTLKQALTPDTNFKLCTARREIIYSRGKIKCKLPVMVLYHLKQYLSLFNLRLCGSKQIISYINTFLNKNAFLCHKFHCILLFFFFCHSSNCTQQKHLAVICPVQAGALPAEMWSYFWQKTHLMYSRSNNFGRNHTSKDLFFNFCRNDGINIVCHLLCQCFQQKPQVLH